MTRLTFTYSGRRCACALYYSGPSSWDIFTHFSEGKLIKQPEQIFRTLSTAVLIEICHEMDGNKRTYWVLVSIMASGLENSRLWQMSAII